MRGISYPVQQTGRPSASSSGRSTQVSSTVGQPGLFTFDSPGTVRSGDHAVGVREEYIRRGGAVLVLPGCGESPQLLFRFPLRLFGTPTQLRANDSYLLTIVRV